jgi:hypothetical protein
LWQSICNRLPRNKETYFSTLIPDDAIHCLLRRHSAFIFIPLQEKVFSEYRIASLANNSILFEIGLSNLIKAFSSAKTAHFVRIKLAKRAGQPCICLEARVRLGRNLGGKRSLSMLAKRRDEEEEGLMT